MIRRVAVWLVLVAGGGLAGWISGIALDRILWHASWDYVYDPGSFRWLGMRWGVFAGSVLGLSGAAGGRRPSTFGQASCVMLTVAAAVWVAAAGGAIGGWLAAKFGWWTHVGLAPTARVLACEGLWRGAAVGAAVALPPAAVRLHRRREKVA